MRIGELAQRAGVNVETVRYYERRRLLPEPPRSPRGHRRYDDETLRFLRAVKQAQRLGFTLAEIEEYLRLARIRSGSASDELRARLATKVDEIDGKIASLRRVRGDLARVLGCACDSLDHCTCGAAYLARRGREPAPASGGTLHVTNGESAGNTLRRTALGGAVVAWADVLHEGPVPAVPPAELRAVRARFLASCGWGDARTIEHDLERREELLENALHDGRHVVLWFEHDLYDQLQLLHVLALAAEIGFGPGRLELVNVDSFPGRPAFRGLGELDADELESLWPGRRRVTLELAELAGAGWTAFRAPDPSAVRRFLERDLAPLPFLAPALRRLLEELPDPRTGLARSELQLLELLAQAPRTPPELFLASQELEEAPYEGDAWAWRRMADLGAGTQPLIVPEDGSPLPAPPPLGDARAFAAQRLRLTEAGRDVLGGKANRVQLLGLDRWLGGTHLLVEPG